MTVRYCLFVFVLSIFCLSSKGQQGSLDPNKQVPLEEFSRILTPPLEVEGRASLYPEWQTAVVFLSQGRYTNNVALNYDPMNNHLLVFVDEKEYFLNPIAVDSIQIISRGQVLINPIILPKASFDQLLVRLHDGHNFSLFRHTKAEIAEEGSKTTSNTQLVYSDKKVKIIEEFRYFLLTKSSGEFGEFLSKKKELKKWQQGDQLLKYAESQKLNLRKEEDMASLFKHYEQLLDN